MLSQGLLREQYQTLNTATNTLRASYEEQVRILEVAWQNQLTVVTSSLTAAKKLSTVALSASVLLSLLSFRISESNAALACFDAKVPWQQQIPHKQMQQLL
jgi:hypothetical protein